MISKKTLKNYEFKSIEDYFNHIVDSLINGQHNQTKDLIKKLSKDQKHLFYNYIDNDILKEEYKKDLIKNMIF